MFVGDGWRKRPPPSPWAGHPPRQGTPRGRGFETAPGPVPAAGARPPPAALWGGGTSRNGAAGGADTWPRLGGGREGEREPAAAAMWAGGGGRRCPHGRGGRRQECPSVQRRARPPGRPARRHEEGWRRGPVLVQVRLDPLLGKPLPWLQRFPGDPLPASPGLPPQPRASPAGAPPTPPLPSPPGAAAAPGGDAAWGWRGSGTLSPSPQRRCRRSAGGMPPVPDPPLPGPAAALGGCGMGGTGGHGPTARGDPPLSHFAGVRRGRRRKEEKYGVAVKPRGEGGNRLLSLFLGCSQLFKHAVGTTMRLLSKCSSRDVCIGDSN